MKQLQPSETLPVGLLLALAGGLLDGYSYLNRGQVFATAETGNIVLMGINLAQGQLDQALHYLLPILAFALGVLAAEQLRRRFGDSTRLHWRLPLLLDECGAILLVSCLQVESFRKFQGCGCVTTMCTGNLRSGTEHLFHWFFHREGTALEKVRVYYGLIGSFIAGAVLSGLLTPLFAGRTILAALVPLLSAFLIMLRGEKRV